MSCVNDQILVVNAGSSSIKFALFRPRARLQRTLVGVLDGIGQPQPMLRVAGTNAAEQSAESVQAPDYPAAVSLLMQWLAERFRSLNLLAVGHRIVHGGPNYAEPQRITPALMDELAALTPLAPLHNPRALLLARNCLTQFSAVPQVACFDTAFHHALPPVAQRLPIPRRFEIQGVRRYGFHGLSYAFLLNELARLDGLESARGRVILAHLGSGASLAAVHHGRPVDTSMGFTPFGGVPMGTRSGDLDPGLLGYLAQVEQLNTAQLVALLSTESGLLGMSETSADMRELLALEATDPRAADAIAVFCYQIRKSIGAFAAALGGLDTLVFAGGIGENAPSIRDRVCAGLAFLGVELDETSNAATAPVIGAPAGRVQVRVIRTDEERTMAQMVCDLLEINRKYEENR